MSDRTVNMPPGHEVSKSETTRTGAHVLRAIVIGAALTGALSACSSGDGGSNGHDNDGQANGVVDTNHSGGLVFTYPVNGQQDVYPGTVITFAFEGKASGQAYLVNDDNGQVVPTQQVNRGNGVFNLYVTDSDAQLAPNAHYSVKADDAGIGARNTRFDNGATLFSFSTEAGPGAVTASTFKIVNHPSGRNDGFPIDGQTYPFTQFNTIRARFSQPVAEGSVKLCTGNERLGDDHCTVAVTGPDGNVPGRLTVLGRNFVFDPGTGYTDPSDQDPDQYADQDLEADQTYRVRFADGFQSASGQSLDDENGFSVTPVSIDRGGRHDVVQRLAIGAVGDDDNDDTTSPLSGRTADNIELAGQLIGSYNLAAVPSPEQGGLQVRLAAFSDSGYNGTIPTVLPRGQRFQLQDFNLALGSQLQGDGTFSQGQIDTPVNLDNLDIQFANDSDVYLIANALRNIKTPTRVTQRLDLNITGHVPQGSPIAALSNGVVNQTALNIVASGEAIPQDNGDVSLVLYGAFPISVNRDGKAAVNFELELTLPASADDQPEIFADQTAQTITAQYPSACTYTFNTLASTGETDDMSTDEDESSRSLFQSGDVVGGVDGTTTLSDTESNCINVLSQRKIIPTNETNEVDGSPSDTDNAPTYNFPNAWANSFPLDSDPSILFSEPVDSSSLAGHISLINSAGNLVASNVRTEGSSVVIHPVVRLKPDTQYTVMVDAGITDLAGNGLESDFPGGSVVSSITFTTEPMVVPTDDNGEPSTIDRSQREAVRQTAPFLTVLTPGLPCALMTSDEEPASDFRSGGNVAGRCIGDDPNQIDQYPAADDPSQAGSVPPNLQVPNPTSVNVVYPVFSHPANASVSGYFSKPVRAETIQLADGCLVNGSGNDNNDATIAVQIMDSGGRCTGVVPGELAKLTPDSRLTQGFSFTPAHSFVAGQRYWIVVCGSKNTLDANRNPEIDQNNNPGSRCSTGKTIIGQNGLALNTDPLNGSGSKIASFASAAGSTPGSSGFNDCQGRLDDPNSAACYDDYRGSGGPDILMPFTGAPATANYLSTTLALPEADTNGNGYFDNAGQPFFPTYAGPGDRNHSVIQGANTGEDRAPVSTDFNESLGRERAQFANVVFTQPLATLGGLLGLSLDGTETFLGGGRTIDIGAAENGSVCGAAGHIAFDNGESVVGEGSLSSCVPVSLPPSAMNTLTSITAAGQITTGRLFLRFPYAANDGGESTGQPQQGFIVPKCQGETPRGESYDYEPCFVASLRLTINGPDGPVNKRAMTEINGGTATGQIRVPQQDIAIKVFGPVAFEQDGRLVISTKNANRFLIIAELGSSNSDAFTPQPTPTDAGDQALQLIGAPIHGGRAFPTR